MKMLTWLAALLVAAVTTCMAAERVERRPPPAVEQFSYNWAAMPLLPRRYANHCGYYNGHLTCADHCGADYQIYYCSPTAAGCCHVGRGYCDGTGRLRCSPALF